MVKPVKTGAEEEEVWPWTKRWNTSHPAALRNMPFLCLLHTVTLSGSMAPGAGFGPVQTLIAQPRTRFSALKETPCVHIV